MIFFNLGILFKQIILVLDLNEILSYLSKDTNKIYLRPSLREFLQNLPSYYELIVVTIIIQFYLKFSLFGFRKNISNLFYS